jgi:uncharacterized protein
MTKIGLISDTHSFLDISVFEYFKDCDEIWHAGDFGSIEILEKLQNFKKFRGVFGNIDSREIQSQVSENQHFMIEGLNVFMTHIGGSPPYYNPIVKKQFKIEIPDIFVCGHSHILRVIKDHKQLNQKCEPMLYINPGAAGNEGFHKIKTLLRFTLDNRKITNLEVIELGKRGTH